jgi:hypothetical protein
MKHQARRVVSVAWPAFLCAAVLEIAVFAFVDPQAMQLLNGSDLPLVGYSRLLAGVLRVLGHRCGRRLLDADPVQQCGGSEFPTRHGRLTLVCLARRQALSRHCR